MLKKQLLQITLIQVEETHLQEALHQRQRLLVEVEEQEMRIECLQ